MKIQITEMAKLNFSLQYYPNKRIDSSYFVNSNIFNAFFSISEGIL